MFPSWLTELSFSYTIINRSIYLVFRIIVKYTCLFDIVHLTLIWYSLFSGQLIDFFLILLYHIVLSYRTTLFGLYNDSQLHIWQGSSDLDLIWYLIKSTSLLMRWKYCDIVFKWKLSLNYFVQYWLSSIILVVFSDFRWFSLLNGLNGFTLVIFGALYSLLFSVSQSSVLKAVPWPIMIYFYKVLLAWRVVSLALLPHLPISMYIWQCLSDLGYISWFIDQCFCERLSTYNSIICNSIISVMQDRYFTMCTLGNYNAWIRIWTIQINQDLL